MHDLSGNVRPLNHGLMIPTNDIRNLLHTGILKIMGSNARTYIIETAMKLLTWHSKR